MPQGRDENEKDGISLVGSLSGPIHLEAAGPSVDWLDWINLSVTARLSLPTNWKAGYNWIICYIAPLVGFHFNFMDTVGLRLAVVGIYLSIY